MASTFFCCGLIPPLVRIYPKCLLRTEERLSRIDFKSDVAQSDENLLMFVQVIIMAALGDDQKVVNVHPYILQSSH